MTRRLPASRADGAPVLMHVTTVPMTLAFLTGQVGFMRERGLSMHAVSSPGPELDRFSEREGVPVSAVEMERRIAPVADLIALRSLLRVIRDVRPEIVHAHTPKGGLLGMIAAWMARVPVRIYHMRGLPLAGARGLRRRLLWWTERVSCALADQVLCVSHSLRDVALQERLCPPGKIRVLAGGSGNGVDAEKRFNPDLQAPDVRSAVRQRLGIPPGSTVVGFVGRIVKDKGIVELAQAWKRLGPAAPDAHLLLVGPFERQDPVPPATEAFLRQDPRVHLAGEDWNTPPLYAAMDVVVLPTYREGFPNVPLEAAAMALPVIATQIPGCVDAVEDGVTGTLVPARDAAALEAAIGSYLRDPDLRRRHGEAGRARVRSSFRQEVIWMSLLHEYHRLLEVAGIVAPPESIEPGKRATLTPLHGPAA